MVAIGVNVGVIVAKRGGAVHLLVLSRIMMVRWMIDDSKNKLVKTENQKVVFLSRRKKCA